uniref:Thioredoxin domain-containing protein 16 n=1 Tax=Callorhinchus milii TaxID=7868 RepID=V9KPH2_CALMI
MMGTFNLSIRTQLQPKVPLDVNVGYRPAGEASAISYQVVASFEEIISLVKGEMKNESTGEQDEEENEDMDTTAIQDDQVAEAIYRDRKRELNLELLHELTDQSFNATLKGAANVLVVFYTAWDAVSQTFLRSYVEAARRLADVEELFLALVNCGDWPDVCSKQNVIQFPTIKMYSQGDNPLLYNGMLGTESLLKFIMLSREPHPIKLTSVDEVEAYLRGELHSDLRSYWELSVLGLFSPNMKEAYDAFIGAANYLRGNVVMAVYLEKNALDLSYRYGVLLPALVFARHWTSSTECIHIEKPTTEEIVYAVKNATLEKFPEVTVENLAVYLQTQKPLLILFIDNDDPKTTKAKEELAELIKIKSLQTYTTCWIDLRNTHVGGEILQVYLNHLPQLPVLVLVYIHSGGHVFAFPEEQLISRKDVLRWLNKVQAGQEDPSSFLHDKEWRPPQTTYDFLAIMDIVRPGFAQQRTPNFSKMKERYEEDKEGENEQSENNMEEDHGKPPKESERPNVHERACSVPHEGKKEQHQPHSEL